MDRKRYLEAIERESAAIADAAGAGLQRRVPSCPEWTVADLVWHVAAVHRFWHQIAERRLQSPKDVTRPQRPPDAGLLGFFAGGVAPLIATLRDADPAAPVYSWSNVKTISFIPRRMAQETAVHRWDAQAAAGVPQPVDATLAADGVDEFLTIFLDAETEPPPATGTFALETTDTGDRWLATVTGEGIAAERGSGAPADATVRGAASDLLLGLWRRVPLEALAREGDAGRAAALFSWADLS